MAKSEFTKTVTRQYWLYRILNWVCLYLPTIVYVVIALANEGIVIEKKIAVVGTVLIAIILTIFNILAKKHIRCVIWIVLIGLYVAFQEFLLLLVILMAIATILDDFVFSPLIQYYYSKMVSAKTIDEKATYEE